MMAQDTQEFETTNYRNASRWGRKLSVILSGSWKREPSPVPVELMDLTGIAPLLIGSGAGGLGWWRIRNTDRANSTEGRELQQAYRMQTLRAAMQERKIQEVFQKLHDAGIDALLIKGWASARLYPEKGLRPLGDIDIYVRAEDHFKAAMVLGVPVNAASIGHEIDLKSSLPGCYNIKVEGLFERSQEVLLGATKVTIPSPEDHLRILCIHFMRHGAWRPLWLCDIAVALESRPNDFDWRRCVGQNKRTAEVVITAIKLANKMLGASLENVPVEYQRQRLPRWLIVEAWKQWETPLIVEHAPPELMSKSLRECWRNPLLLFSALKKRWPNPIETLVTMRVPLSVFSPLPWQCVWYLRLCFAFIGMSRKKMERSPDGKS